ncbi:diguanylate cyclase (GGDEF) domain-containing protein/HDIG domain-containing protein [Thermoleophilum album]|uniref:Diguanylate cyclase (GGDEF) domain-containing protein/HDIG domain-containing protein n=2 Tax=Thermoleophilum album TaxID=29539 RepID=A0A1H6FKK3_THEAL|nr:diguanylate cyclase (GGDEF) domain-containing protein/HDIG domain-containing protein [Thermoleophilum album]
MAAWLGALVALVAALLPGEHPAHRSLLLVSAAGAAALGAALWLSEARLTPLRAHLAVILATVLATLTVVGWGAERGYGTLAYTWVAVAAFLFFSGRLALLHVALIATAYGGVLLAQRGEIPANAWLATTTSLVGAGLLVSVARYYVAGLVRRLNEAAGKDPLTGLATRRALAEVFDVELERARRSERPLAVLVIDVDRFKRINDRFGHRAGDEVLSEIAQVIERSKRAFDLAARHGGEEFALLAPDCDEHGAYQLAERLREAVERHFARHQYGPVAVSIGASVHPVHGETLEALLAAADQAMYAAKRLGRNRVVISSAELETARTAERSGEERATVELAALVDLAEAVDRLGSGSASHCRRVARFAELTARELGLPAQRVEQVRLAALLHDVGTIALPDSVEQKAGPLSDEEWEFVRTHPVVGARMLEVSEQRELGAWVRAHHEHLDGTGYPLGLHGDEVPLEARIIAVADAYEAMTSDRPYRPAMSHDEAAAELRAAAGSRFDRRVVEALLRALA